MTEATKTFPYHRDQFCHQPWFAILGTLVQIERARIIRNKYPSFRDWDVYSIQLLAAFMQKVNYLKGDARENWMEKYNPIKSPKNT